MKFFTDAIFWYVVFQFAECYGSRCHSIKSWGFVFQVLPQINNGLFSVDWWACGKEDQLEKEIKFGFLEEWPKLRCCRTLFSRIVPEPATRLHTLWRNEIAVRLISIRGHSLLVICRYLISNHVTLIFFAFCLQLTVKRSKWGNR